MEGTTTSAKVSGGWSDFFGSVKGAAQDYLYTLGNEILPNWTQKQLTDQMGDYLKNDTYNQAAAPPRVETISAQSPTLFDYNENYQAPVTQDKTGKMLAIGLLVIVGAVAVKGLL